MASDRTRELEDRLVELLDRVIDWLQFAESKNTGVVGLIATALGLLVTFFVTSPSLPTLAALGLGLGAVLLMIGLLLVVASFLPKTDSEHATHPDLRTTYSFMGTWPATSPRRWSGQWPAATWRCGTHIRLRHLVPSTFSAPVNHGREGCLLRHASVPPDDPATLDGRTGPANLAWSAG